MSPRSQQVSDTLKGTLPQLNHSPQLPKCFAAKYGKLPKSVGDSDGKTPHFAKSLIPGCRINENVTMYNLMEHVPCGDVTLN